MFYFYMRVSLISDDEKNIKMKHISRMAEPQQTENVPRLRIKALPMTAPNAKAKTIAEEINALWLSSRRSRRPYMIALCVAERRFPIHMVVATLASSIFRKVST